MFLRFVFLGNFIEIYILATSSKSCVLNWDCAEDSVFWYCMMDYNKKLYSHTWLKYWWKNYRLFSFFAKKLESPKYIIPWKCRYCTLYYGDGIDIQFVKFCIIIRWRSKESSKGNSYSNCGFFDHNIYCLLRGLICAYSDGPILSSGKIRLIQELWKLQSMKHDRIEDISIP
jgi:hypothetical protein